VANGGNNTISKIDSGGNVSSFATGLGGGPRGLAFDSSSNLYAALDNNTIGKINSAGTVSVFVSSGLSSPQGLTFDNSGYLYVANATAGSIDKVDTSATLTSFATGLGFPVGIAFGSSGNLFAANNSGSLTVLQITTGGSSSTFSSGLNSPSYLAFAPVIVPEPSSFVLAALASGVMWMVARKRSALS
jgi:sugar lactone lactonase YvrE